MNFYWFFVQFVQNGGYNMEEEKKKVNTGIGYKNGKYRPSVFIDKERQKDIEKHFRNKGYKSFNEYINELVFDDMSKVK